MLKPKKYKKVVLIILDGFGVASPSRGNAVFLAGTPYIDELVRNFPTTTLQASGPLVGLPWGEMGNSEVGHLNIGAGRIVGQDLPRINNSISNGEFYKNPTLLAACEHVKTNNSSLHLVGMASSGNVHSSLNHLFALLALAQGQGLSRVFMHIFLDGRDTPERVALEDIASLRKKVAEIGVGEIATVAGRFYAMDRGGHWNQTEETYRALVNGAGPTASTAEAAIMANYEKGIFDEMVPPTVIVNETGEPVAKIGSSDAIVYFNFRQDRALQLTQSFVDVGHTPLAGKLTVLQNVYFVTMTEYQQGLPVHVAFAPPELVNNLASYISAKQLTQFHAAESEKYAHVTAFFNCGVTNQLPGEGRQIVTSPSNSNNYVDRPAMASKELTDVLVEQITKTETNFILANYANADMVGHTGSLQASQRAVQSLDVAMGMVSEAVLSVDAALIITADHGNIEQLIDLKTGDIDKDHTTNPVPFILIANEFKGVREWTPNYMSLAGVVPEGAISDIAPTILDLLGIEKPQEMTAVSLLPALR